jgi:hypothetical protein
MTEINQLTEDEIRKIEVQLNSEYADHSAKTVDGIFRLIESNRSFITTIESQKEEIKRLMGVNQHLEIDLSESKAITELAVKWLKEVEFLITQHEHSPHFYEESKELFESIFSEIERLQNDSTS